MDNRGNVTVVLNWDRDRILGQPLPHPSSASSSRAASPHHTKDGAPSSSHYSQQQHHHSSPATTTWTVVDVHASASDSGLVTPAPTILKGAHSSGRSSASPTFAAQATASSSTRSPSPKPAIRANLSLDGLSARPYRSSDGSQPRVSFLTRNGELSNEFDEDSEDSDEDVKTECEAINGHDHSQCDFHCSALHKNGAQIKVQVSRIGKESKKKDSEGI